MNLKRANITKTVKKKSKTLRNKRTNVCIYEIIFSVYICTFNIICFQLTETQTSQNIIIKKITNKKEDINSKEENSTDYSYLLIKFTIGRPPFE